MKDIAEIIPFGDQEPELSKLTKQLYCIVQHDSPIKKIDFKDFITNIKEYCKIKDFPWTCKYDNGRRKYPSYDKKNGAKNWFKRYDYREAYRIYANYMNGEDETDLLLLEKTLKDADIRLLFTIAQDILNEIESLPKEPKYEYRRKASIETYKIIMDEIRERLQITPNDDDNTSEVIPVSDNPEHELEEIAEEWDKLMWKEIGEDRPW